MMFSVKQRTTFVAMLVGGIAVGWIMGLSVSPVTQTVLGAMVTVLAGAAAIFAGIRPALVKPAESDAALESEPPARPTKSALPNVLPIAGLLVGTALGASSGVWARTHNLLSPSPDAQVSEWTAASGLPKHEVALLLLGGKAETGSLPLQGTGLNAAPANACFEVNSALRAGDTETLSTALQSWWPAIRQALGGQPADARTLQVLAKVMCP